MYRDKHQQNTFENREYQLVPNDNGNENENENEDEDEIYVDENMDKLNS